MINDKFRLNCQKIAEYVYEKQTKLIGKDWFDVSRPHYVIDLRVNAADFVKLFPYVQIAKGESIKFEDTDLVIHKLSVLTESLIAFTLQMYHVAYGRFRKGDYKAEIEDIICSFPDSKTIIEKHLENSEFTYNYLPIIDNTNSIMISTNGDVMVNLILLTYYVEREFGITFDQITECITGEPVNHEGEQLVMQF